MEKVPQEMTDIYGPFSSMKFVQRPTLNALHNWRKYRIKHNIRKNLLFWRVGENCAGPAARKTDVRLFDSLTT